MDKTGDKMKLKKLWFVIIALLPVAAQAIDIEYGFSPNGKALNLILKEIDNAKVSIDVAAYAFTSQPISVALLHAKKRGVEVRLVADKKANKHYTAATFLANQHVPVKLNGRYKIMHNKFMVFDHKTVETGSFNYSKAAFKSNAENVIVIHGDRDLAIGYEKEFAKLWEQGDELLPNY